MSDADFLGKGWRFPVENDSEGIVMTAGEENIFKSIWIILATARGERAMRPEFGCGLHDLLFSVPDSATVASAANEVRRALTVWEPRIDVLDVVVETREDGAVLVVNIHYRVRLTNNVFNFVYPFYLEARM